MKASDPPAGRGSPTPLLLTDATLVNGSGARPLPATWLRIEEGRIVAIGQGAPPSDAGARRLELAGHTILPGLSDMHVHLGTLAEARWILKLLLAHGVTRIKEAGNQLGNLAAIRRWHAEDPALPRLSISGVTLNGSESELRFLLPGEPTRRLLEDNQAFGVDFIKIHNWISSGAFRQIVGAARSNGTPLTGHVPLSMTSSAAIFGGMSILEHVRLLPAEVHDDPLRVAGYPLDLGVMRRTGHWAEFDENADAIKRTLDAWEAHRDTFFLDPTLVTNEASSHADGTPRPSEPPMELVSPAARARIAPLKARFSGDLSPDEFARARAAGAGMRAFVGLASARGIRVLTGTDISMAWIVPGASLHRELELLVSAGLSPVDAIHASTGQAAAAFGDTDRGILRVGAVADAVVVSGDASADIGRVRAVEHVLLGGVLHDPADLRASAAAYAEMDREAGPVAGGV